MEYSYTREKLYDIIKYLAIANGDMRERLKHLVVEIDIIDNQSLPDELQSKWDTVIKLLTKHEAKYNFRGELELGIYEVNLNRMRNTTACKIATIIFEIYEVLTIEYN